MKPVTFETSLAGFGIEGQLCLFRIDLATINYLERILAANGTIQSKGGINLPPEICLTILDFLDQDAAAKSTEKWSFVTAAVSQQPPPDETIVHCVRHDFGEDSERGKILAGHFRTTVQVKNFELFLQSPGLHHGCSIINRPRQPALVHRSAERHADIPSLRPVSGPGRGFFISLRRSVVSQPCLWTDVTVPDVISRIDRGACFIYTGGRSWSPNSCPSWYAQKTRENFERAYRGSTWLKICPFCSKSNIPLLFSLVPREDCSQRNF